MNIAFVQHAQNNVDRDDGCKNQEGFTRERVLKCRGRSLKRGMDARRQLNILLYLLDGLGGIAQGSPRRQVEGKCYHRKLSLMVDGERCIR